MLTNAGRQFASVYGEMFLTDQAALITYQQDLLKYICDGFRISTNEVGKRSEVRRSAPSQCHELQISPAGTLNDSTGSYTPVVRIDYDAQ